MHTIMVASVALLRAASAKVSRYREHVVLAAGFWLYGTTPVLLMMQYPARVYPLSVLYQVSVASAATPRAAAMTPSMRNAVEHVIPTPSNAASQ